MVDMMSNQVNSKKTIFKPGDQITFECSDLQNDKPRWQYNDDTGKSNIWAKGMVTYVDNNIIAVDYKNDYMATYKVCTWPNVDHDDYCPSQWSLDGYLQLLGPEPICECGAQAVYGSDTSLHSMWCPKFSYGERS